MKDTGNHWKPTKNGNHWKPLESTGNRHKWKPQKYLSSGGTPSTQITSSGGTLNSNSKFTRYPLNSNKEFRVHPLNSNNEFRRCPLNSNKARHCICHSPSINSDPTWPLWPLRACRRSLKLRETLKNIAAH